MRWRASEHLLQVVDDQALDATLLALLDQGPIDLTLACEPGLLPTASLALQRALPNLLQPPPANALRASEQLPPFTALLPRLQQPEPALVAAWLDWAAERDLPGRHLPACTADDWCALAADDATARPTPNAGLQPRVAAAAQALAHWSAWFSASFAPGELAATFAGTDATADATMPMSAQPEPLLQKFRPRPTADGWQVLRQPAHRSLVGHAAAAASAAQAKAGSWRAAGHFSGPAGDLATQAGRYTLALRGNNLEATVTLHLAALRAAPEPGQMLALALRTPDGLGLRLRGPAGARPAGGSWTVQLQRRLSAADAAQLRAQPADKVLAELWWAPGA